MPTRQQRIDWLLANQGLWEGLPAGHYAVMPNEHRERLAVIAQRLQDAGLYSARVHWQTLVKHLYGLINEARRQRRTGKK